MLTFYNFYGYFKVIISFCLWICIFSSCQSKAQLDPVDSSNQVDQFASQDYSEKDTIIVNSTFDGNYYFKYSNEEFNEIISNNPEFFRDTIWDPHYLYYNRSDSLNFTSELGQDKYFALYAYFLKLRNGDEKYLDERVKILGLLLALNEFDGETHGRGTYHGHQKSRAPAIAEYFIYILIQKGIPIGLEYDSFRSEKDEFISYLFEVAKKASIGKGHPSSDFKDEDYHVYFQSLVADIDTLIDSSVLLEIAENEFVERF